DTDDARESPGLEIVEWLIRREAGVGYSDPPIPRLPIGRPHKVGVPSVPPTDTSLPTFAASLLLPDYSGFPYALPHRWLPVIVDTRNGLRSRGLHGSHIVLA